MIKRGFNLDIRKLEVKPIVEKEDKKKEEFEPLKRVLIIGPNYPNRCHFSENIYDEWKEREGYDIRIRGDTELPIHSMHTEKGLALPLSSLIDPKEWKPQLIIIDQISINFLNDQTIPVFYHHREFKRIPTVFYPSLVWFWHEDILKFFETKFTKEWMAQVHYKGIMYIPFDPKKYYPQEKEFKGVIGIGYREDPFDIYQIDELTEVAPVILLEQEYNLFKSLGFQMFDTPITDEQYRDILPKCEAIWVPLSIRQYTSRRMIEAMGCKTLCVLKLEGKRHEEILERMGFVNGEHYIGVKRLEDIKRVYEATKNKSKIVENAYNIVMESHTYQNRIDQIIKTYEGVINKNL